MVSAKQPPRPLPPPEPPPPEPCFPRPDTPAENYVPQCATIISTRADPRASSPDTIIDNRESPTPPPPPEPPSPEPRHPRPDAPAATCAHQHAMSTCADPRAPSPETIIPSDKSPTPLPLPEPPPPKPRRYKPGTSTATDAWQGATNAHTNSSAPPLQRTTIHSWERPPPPSKPPTPEACRHRQGTAAIPRRCNNSLDSSRPQVLQPPTPSSPPEPLPRCHSATPK